MDKSEKNIIKLYQSISRSYKLKLVSGIEKIECLKVYM